MALSEREYSVLTHASLAETMFCLSGVTVSNMRYNFWLVYSNSKYFLKFH